MCPFLRPIDDTFGGQPVFHCQNVVQASETDKTDGFEDDDENYYDDGMKFNFFSFFRGIKIILDFI